MHWQHFQAERPQYMTTDKIIQRWRNQRQKLLILMTRLAERKKSQEKMTTKEALRSKLKEKEIPNLLQNFWEQLIDYTIAGPFQVFPEISEVLEKEESTKQIVPKLLKQLQINNEKILKFNDEYTKNKKNNQLNVDLLKDLSTIFEYLAVRFDWEDELVIKYFEVTSKLANEKLMHKKNEHENNGTNEKIPRP